MTVDKRRMRISVRSLNGGRHCTKRNKIRLAAGSSIIVLVMRYSNGVELMNCESKVVNLPILLGNYQTDHCLQVTSY